MKQRILSIAFATFFTASLATASLTVSAAAQTRAEALVSLIQAIGREDEALATTAENPFTDVPEWADRYAAYAYEHGIIAEVCDNLFDSDREITAEEYTAMLERAKGLADTNTPSADGNSLQITDQVAQ